MMQLFLKFLRPCNVSFSLSIQNFTDPIAREEIPRTSPLARFDESRSLRIPKEKRLEEEFFYYEVMNYAAASLFYKRK